MSAPTQRGQHASMQRSKGPNLEMWEILAAEEAAAMSALRRADSALAVAEDIGEPVGALRREVRRAEREADAAAERARAYQRAVARSKKEGAQ